MKNKRYILVLLFSLTIFSGCDGLLLSSHHDIKDYTPVFAAAESNNVTELKKYIDSKPSLIKEREWDNKTLLHDAVGHNAIDSVKYLLSKKADVNAKAKEDLTPLHMAAQNGNIEIIKLLINAGADVRAKDAKGWTPLDRAVKWSHKDAADFLRGIIGG